MSEETNEVVLHHPTKKTNSGLIFYRSCVVNSQTFSVGHNVTLRDENRNKLGYLLKIYCRTKGNERALVRWYFTDADLEGEKQVCPHEVFATSYTGKVAISSIRKLVHIRFEKNQHDIPADVPKDIYYVFRYFDHEKQCLVPHEEQLIKVRYLPKPEPDSAGSALSGAGVLEDMKVETKLYSPYNEGGFKYYKVCMVGKLRYNVGDCVLLTERDSSSMRRITRFSYNQHKTATAMGQFIYFQNELTLSPEQRNELHPNEVVASNWQSELLMSNVKRKVHLLHLNIFQPVPQSCPKNIYCLKRFYEPFKKKLFPLMQPLTKADLSIIPEAWDEPESEAVISTDEHGVTSCKVAAQVAEDVFRVGDFISVQSGSAICRVLKLWSEDGQSRMSILRLYKQRELPSSIRSLVPSPLQLTASDEVYTISCLLYFDNVSVSLDSLRPVDGHYFVDCFYDVENTELYKLKSKLTTDPELVALAIPERGELITDLPSSSDEKEQRKKAKPENKEETRSKADKAKDKEEERAKKEQDKEEKLAQFQHHKEEQNRLISHLQDKEVTLSEVSDGNQFSWARVGKVKASVGDCVFVKLVEGIQLGRIISIYKDKEGVMRLKMYRYYLEEEMFVTPKESKTIHINEVFACDFIIYALLCQLDEVVDVVYLKKREKIPPQKDIPKGRLYVKRYYHPIKHIMRPLKDYLDAQDMSIIPQPSTPIAGTYNKALNTEVKEDLNTSAVIEASLELTSTPKAKEQKKPTKPSLFQTITKNFGKKTEVTKTISDRGMTIREGKDEVKGELNAGKDEVKESKVESLPGSVRDNTNPEESSSTVDCSKDKGPVDLAKCEITHKTEPSFDGAKAVPPTIQIVNPNTEGTSIEFNPSSIQIITSEDSKQVEISENQFQIIPSQIQIVGADDGVFEGDTQVQISENQIQISENQIQISENQIQISENHIQISENQIQIGEPLTSQIEIVQAPLDVPNSQIQISENQIHISAGQMQIGPPSTEQSGRNTPLLPIIISSEQPMEGSLSVDICHTSDGSITIAEAPVKAVKSTVKFEEAYTEGDKTLYKKCVVNDETLVQGDTVYIRCGETDTESWKIGRVMEFYMNNNACARVMWFYGEEEMVVSKNELAGIHDKEIFASTCFDEVEMSTVESQVNVVYLQKGEPIPRDIPPNTLYCKRFYDPFKHVIRQLKTRLKAGDVSILPEAAVKRSRPDNVVTKVAVQSVINGIKPKKTRTASPIPKEAPNTPPPQNISQPVGHEEPAPQQSTQPDVISSTVQSTELVKSEGRSEAVTRSEVVSEATVTPNVASIEVKTQETIGEPVVSEERSKPESISENGPESISENGPESISENGPDDMLPAEEPSDLIDTVYMDY